MPVGRGRRPQGQEERACPSLQSFARPASYETIFILRPDANEEERNRVFDRVSSVMDKLEGHLIQRDVWGERKLSYKMKKYDRGTYYYYRYLGYGDLVSELERNFRLLDPVSQVPHRQARRRRRSRCPPR